MRRVVANLVAAVDTLKRSGWGSAPAVAELVTSAIMVIGPLHDRAEPALLEILRDATSEFDQEATGELEAGADPAAAPGTRQDKEEG